MCIWWKLPVCFVLHSFNHWKSTTFTASHAHCICTHLSFYSTQHCIVYTRTYNTWPAVHCVSVRIDAVAAATTTAQNISIRFGNFRRTISCGLNSIILTHTDTIIVLQHYYIRRRVVVTEVSPPIKENQLAAFHHIYITRKAHTTIPNKRHHCVVALWKCSCGLACAFLEYLKLINKYIRHLFNYFVLKIKCWKQNLHESKYKLLKVHLLYNRI